MVKKQNPRQPNPSGTCQILIPLDRSSKPRIVRDLTEKEYAAIGSISVQWSVLEHALLGATIEIAERIDPKQPIPNDCLNLSFKKRLRAWRILIEENERETEKKRLLKLVSKIANAEQDRHKILHGIWDWDTANPETLVVSSWRQPYLFEKGSDADKLIRLATKIGELIYEILYGDRDPQEVLIEDATETGAFVSRSFLLKTMKKGP